MPKESAQTSSGQQSATLKQGNASKGHPLHYPQAYRAHLPSYWGHLVEKTAEWGRSLKVWPFSQRDQMQRLSRELNSVCKGLFTPEDTELFFIDRYKFLRPQGLSVCS